MRVPEELIREEGVLMLGPQASTYTVSQLVGVNQVTTWRHVAIYLRKVDPGLWMEVQVVLKRNLKRSREYPMDKTVPGVVK